MSGGQFGTRGYLYQATVCLLDSLMNAEWDYVVVEPNSKNEKVDILWKNNGKIIKAMQVKSSINLFKKWQINKWICDLVEDSIDAEVFEVVLVGECNLDAKKFVDAINANQENVFDKRLENYKGKIKVKLIEYNYDSTLNSINILLHEYCKNKSYDIGSSSIKMISKASIFDYIKFSAQGRKISKEEFEKRLNSFVQSVKVNSSDKVIRMEFNESKEEIPKIEINTKKYAFKLIMFVIILIGSLVAIKYYNVHIFDFIVPQINNNKFFSIISIVISFISIVLVLIMFNISDYEFLKICDEYYPILSGVEMRTCYHPWAEVIVTETRLRKGRIVFVEHEVEVCNKLDEVINLCDLTFEGTNKGITIMNEDFLITRLNPKESIVGYKKVVQRQWDCPEEDQYKFIGKLNIGDNNISENIELFTPRLIKTYFLELNYYNYMQILNYKVPFEVSWIIERMKFMRLWYSYKLFGWIKILVISLLILILILILIGLIKLFSLIILSFIIYILTEKIFIFLEGIFLNY